MKAAGSFTGPPGEFLTQALNLNLYPEWFTRSKMITILTVIIFTCAGLYMELCGPSESHRVPGARVMCMSVVK